MMSLIILFAWYVLAGIVYYIVLSIVPTICLMTKYGVDKVYNAAIMFYDEKHGWGVYGFSGPGVVVKQALVNLLLWPYRYTANAVVFVNTIKDLAERQSN